MTETSSELTPPSGDTNNVLPNLSEAKAPVSVTITIDRSVRKIAAWVIAVMISASVLIGAGIVLAAWMVVAYLQADRDARMVEYYIHELDGKLIAAGFIKPSQRFDKQRIQEALEAEKESQQ